MELFKLLTGCWIGFVIGTIIYAGIRYLLTGSIGDMPAILWGATSMTLVILFVDYMNKK